MSGEAEHPWSSAGEPTTTNYAMGGVNEFGQRVPPKPVHNLHGVAVPRFFPLSDHTIREMVQEHIRRTERAPTKLYLRGPYRGTRCKGVTVPGFGPVLLDIEYEAAQNHVR